MNTLFDQMLKHHREKKQIINAQVTNNITNKDINDVFRHSNTHLEDNKILVENEHLTAPTLFKPSKISEQYHNPKMIIRQSSRVLTSPKTQ